MRIQECHDCKLYGNLDNMVLVEVRPKTLGPMYPNCRNGRTAYSETGEPEPPNAPERSQE